MKFDKNLGFATTPERSALMSKIRSKQTKAEILLRKELWGMGYRYRINYKALPGSPDIVLKRKHIVIFIDGEFWHGYNWETKKTKIKANRDYWLPKIERNMQRDLENNLALAKMGYTVLRFWEYEIKKELNSCVDKIRNVLRLQS